MRKVQLTMICTLLLLSGCMNLNLREDDEIVQSEEPNHTEVSILPTHKLSDSEYKMLLPFKPSRARGAITNQITNRVDIDELEDGLRRHSTEVFDPDKYVYEEGQYFTTKDIYTLIDNLNPEVADKETTEEQVKEYRENPRVFSHILEQNFLQRKDDTVELVGISIGISLKSVYRFTTEIGGPQYYEDIPMDEMLEEGKKIAQEIVSVARGKEGLEEVPIMIALFREEKQSSPVPGHFVAKTVVEEGSRTLGKWENINEKHILYSSRNVTETSMDDYQKVTAFGNRISEYFPNYVGMVAEGFYINDSLTKLTIDVPIEFYGRSEVVGFTQYAYGLVKEIFQNHYDIEVVISSMNDTEAIIYRGAGDDETMVHIFN